MWKRRLPLFALVISVLLGAFLRLYQIEAYLTFLGDEGRDVLIVRRIFTQADFPFIGPTSSVGGFFLGPLYYYLMAPALWIFNFDPVGPAVMVAVLGAITIGLIWYFTKEAFSPLAANIAALLYAASPVVIRFSRSSWNPNVVPFFAMLLLIQLHRLQRSVTYWRLFSIGLLLGMGIQCHYVFSFLYVVSAIWYFYIRRSLKHIKEISIVIIGVLLPLTPFFLFEIKHGFPNAMAFYAFFTQGNETSFVFGATISTIFGTLFQSVSRLLLRIPETYLWNGFPDWYIAVLFSGSVIVTIVSMLFILWRAFNVQVRKESESYRLLLIWWIIPVLLFGLYRKEIYDYYLAIFFPVPFIAFSLVLTWLYHRFYWLRFLLILLLGVIFIFNLEGRPTKYPPNRQLSQTKMISSAVLQLANNEPYNFALITATNSDHAYRYFLELSSNPPVQIKQPHEDLSRETVTDQLLVVCEDPACQVLGYPSWDVAGFGKAEITHQESVSVVKVVRLVHALEPNTQ